MNTPMERILAKLPDARRSGTGWSARCPAHDDRRASLSVGEDDRGAVLIHCHATCAPEAVIRAIGLEWVDLFPPEPERRNGHAKARAGRIVATYDYFTADGVLSFQVARYDPKDFKQRRPHPQLVGKWEWKAGNVDLPYRLPQLARAPADAWVFVCEGEKDCDNVAAETGLAATTNAGGAKKWRAAHAEALRGRRVAILPDNDPAGRVHILKVATSLHGVAADVRVVALPDLPDKGDVSDWLAAGGTAAELLRQVEAAPRWEPSAQDADVAALLDTVPAFPLETLPHAFRALVTQAARTMVAPPDFIALPLLVAAGAMIGNALELEVKPGWREGTNLYGAYVGDPGSKKTPSSSLAVRPVYRLQKRLNREFDRRYAEYEAELAGWEGRNKKERGPKPKPPEYEHLVTTDATVEALAPMLQKSKGLLLTKDELTGWVRGMDQYKAGGKGSDRAHYLSMWSRQLIKVDRKSNPRPVVVAQPHLSVIGGIQPDLLPELADAAQREDGFLDRILLSFPERVPDRFLREGLDVEAVRAVEAIFEALCALRPDEDGDGDEQPAVVRLSPCAVDLLERWYGEHAAETERDGFPPHLRGPWAKMPSQLARLALILHALEHAEPIAEIGDATLARAMDLVDYFKGHARRVYRRLAGGKQDRKLAVLQALKEQGPLSTRDLFDTFHRNVSAEKLHRDLEALEALGLIVRRQRKGKTGHPATEWAAE